MLNDLKAVLILTSLLLGSALNAPAAQADLVREVGSAQVNWTHGTMRVTGSGAVGDKGNAGQKRLLAKRAAISDAYRQLAEAVNGVQVFAETTVKDFVTESDTIRLQVKAVIRGAHPVGETRYLSDGTVEVDVEMPIFGRGSLAQAVELGQAIETQLGQPYSSLQNYLAFRGIYLPAATPQDEFHRGLRLAQQEGYTGLVIDASGLAAEPAMGPFIVGAGARIHPNNKIEIDPERIVQEGPLHYVEDLDEAKEDTDRVGDNPLVVRAKAAMGNPVRSNILLDQSTAQKIMQVNEDAKFLDELKVTLVL